MRRHAVKQYSKLGEGGRALQRKVKNNNGVNLYTALPARAHSKRFSTNIKRHRHNNNNCL